MLREEMEKYTELTGEDATHVPIMKLGAYLDGYDKGLEVVNKIKTEIEKQDEWLAQAGYNAYNVDIAFNSIKRVIAESEE